MSHVIGPRVSGLTLIQARWYYTQYRGPRKTSHVHPKFDLKKHGNGIHPPIGFLVKCVSLVRPINIRASLLSVSGEIT
jgi:hypothetical protein